MKIAFQADADLHPAIRNGVRRREPLVDFRTAAGVLADGTPDLEVWRIAAEDGRVLISNDVRTMFGHSPHPIIAIHWRGNQEYPAHLDEFDSKGPSKSHPVSTCSP